MSKLLYYTFHEDVITNTCPMRKTRLANIRKGEWLKTKEMNINILSASKRQKLFSAIKISMQIMRAENL